MSSFTVRQVYPTMAFLAQEHTPPVFGLWAIRYEKRIPTTGIGGVPIAGAMTVPAGPAAGRNAVQA